MTKEQQEKDEEKYRRWEEMDFETLLMLYRDICYNLAVLLYKREDVEKITYESYIVKDLIMKKYYYERMHPTLIHD